MLNIVAPIVVLFTCGLMSDVLTTNTSSNSTVRQYKDVFISCL